MLAHDSGCASDPPNIVDLRHSGLQPGGIVERGLSHELCKEGMSTFGGCRSSGE